jgi:hypothetical protein
MCSKSHNSVITVTGIGRPRALRIFAHANRVSAKPKVPYAAVFGEVASRPIIVKAKQSSLVVVKWLLALWICAGREHCFSFSTFLRHSIPPVSSVRISSAICRSAIACSSSG